VSDELQNDLLESAKRFARSALRARSDRQYDVFFLYAGIAIELLAKAFLASQNPAFIARPNDFASLLQASGFGTRPQSEMRTIGFDEALNRVGHFVHSLGKSKERRPQELNRLGDLRNGVAHLGQDVQHAAAEQVLVPFLRGCDALLAAMKIERPDFWGDLTEVVKARLAEFTEAAVIRATEAVAAARTLFESRWSSTPPEELEGVLKAIEASYEVSGNQRQLVVCPACGRQAMVVGTTEVANWEPDYDQGDFGETYSDGSPEAVERRRSMCPVRQRIRTPALGRRSASWRGARALQSQTKPSSG
jgi:hypothetical protein